jgi:hypothetical protein
MRINIAQECMALMEWSPSGQTKKVTEELRCMVIRRRGVEPVPRTVAILTFIASWISDITGSRALCTTPELMIPFRRVFIGHELAEI